MDLPTYITGTTQTKAYRLLREHVYEALEEFSLTPMYWSMLGIVMQAKDGVRQVEIAGTLHVKPPMVTTMAHDLQARGLIQSVQNQFDARAKLLALTPAGKKFVKNVESSLSHVLARLLHGLTEQDLDAYHRVLVAIIENDAILRNRP